MLLAQNAFSAATDSFAFGTTSAGASSLSITTTNYQLDVQTGITLGSSGRSNSAKSYTLRVTSANGGLRNANALSKGGSLSIGLLPYTLQWINTALPSGGTVTNPALTINSTSTQNVLAFTDNIGNGNNTTMWGGSLRFSITGYSAGSLYSGTYADTLSVQMFQGSNPVGSVGTLTLTATIADTITITITPTASASNLPLTSTQSQLNIGTVSITSNCQNGYTLKIASSNSGRLIHSLAGGAPQANEKINYSLFYNNSQITASSTAVTVSSSNSATMISSSTQIGSVGISYTGVSTGAMRNGTYQDNLTFTLQSQ